MGGFAEFRWLGSFRRQRGHWSSAPVDAVGSVSKTPLFLSWHQVLFKKCMVMPGRYGRAAEKPSILPVKIRNCYLVDVIMHT